MDTLRKKVEKAAAREKAREVVTPQKAPFNTKPSPKAFRSAQYTRALFV